MSRVFDTQPSFLQIFKNKPTNVFQTKNIIVKTAAFSIHFFQQCPIIKLTRKQLYDRNSFSLHLRYDSTNQSHFKTREKFKELGVDTNWALENGWDWSAVGGVTPPKDQARTGTCWSFSAAAVAESIWWINGNSLTAFSSQVLIDCLRPTCEGDYCTDDKAAAINRYPHEFQDASGQIFFE